MVPVEEAPQMAENKKQTTAANLPPISKLINLVEYQENAVVSKTLIDTRVESVTVFAFAAGQGLSEHTAPFEAMLSILDGEADVIVSDKSFHLKAGEMITIPANKPHSLAANHKFKMMLVMQRV
jgi:quercetin dioxygenase-like cupin family protein